MAKVPGNNHEQHVAGMLAAMHLQRQEALVVPGAGQYLHIRQKKRSKTNTMITRQSKRISNLARSERLPRTHEAWRSSVHSLRPPRSSRASIVVGSGAGLGVGSSVGLGVDTTPLN